MALPLTVAQVDITIANNETFMLPFQFGNPTDTSWSFAHKDLYCDIKNSPEETTSILSLSTVVNTIQIFDPILRIMNFNVDDETIFNKFPAGKYVYDLIMVDQTTDDTQRLMTGKLIVVEGVTKRP